MASERDCRGVASIVLITRSVMSTLRGTAIIVWPPVELAIFFLLWIAAVARGEESMAQRRERVEAMSAAQKEELFRHREQFQAMSAGERQRIRQLHEQLQQEPDGDKLRETMRRYCQWLTTLPPYRRAQLIEMKPAQRLKHVKQLLQQEQAKTVGKRLGAKDHEAVVRWMEQYAAEHEAGLLELLPEARREQTAKLGAAMRRREATKLAYQRWLLGNPAAHPPTTKGEMADLVARLSPEARAFLAARAGADQPRVLAFWLRSVAKRELSNRPSEGASLLPGVDEQLADFFEFQLNDEERDRLMGLPGDEMQQKLREMYLTRTKVSEPGSHPPDRPGRVKKPGPPVPKPKRGDKEKIPPVPG